MLNTLAKTLAKARFSTLSDTLGDGDGEARLDTSDETVAKVESHPHHDTLSYVQAKALISTLVVALDEANHKDLAAAKVIERPRLETLGVSLKAIKAYALADTMADTVPAVKA